MTNKAPDAASAEQEETSADEKAREIAELEQKLEVARARLSLAQLETAAFEAKHEIRLRHAGAEIDMAQAKLAQFREADAPSRLASEQLSLRTAKDRAQEAVDELAQIEIMYDEQDLDDLTAEFVVSRGRRNAERAAARIEIQEAKLKTLEERELPQEQAGLELALDKKVTGLAEIEREDEIGRGNKAIAVTEAENTITKLEAELAELRAETMP